MKPLTLLSFLLLCCQFSFAQSIYKATVYFDTNSDVLTKAGEDELSPHLTTPNLTTIRIEGHTDDEGNIEYNWKLSQRRANTVKAYLNSSGIASELIEISFFGEEAPLTENQTDADKSLNRRVEATFYYAPVIQENPISLVEEISKPVVEPATTINDIPDSTVIKNAELYAALAAQVPSYEYIITVSYTHLTLPTILLV